MDWSPLVLSLQAALLSTGIAFVIGIYLAWIASRMKRFRGLLDGLLTLPLVLPPTVVGFFLLILLGKNSFLGQWLNALSLPVVFTPAATVIASTVVALPLMYRTVSGAFSQIDQDILSAARTLGMGEHRIFRTIMLPNAVSGIAAGTILTFARALGEFGATIMIAGNIPGKTQTMSVAVYSAMSAGNRELAYQWAAVIGAISLASVIGMNFVEARLRRKRDGRISWR